MFLPGDHILDTNISVANIAGLVMYGVSSSGIIVTVVCNGSVGLSFISMLDLKICSLSFTGFNYHRNENTYKVRAALLLHSIQYAELVNCSFHENFGPAVAVHNTSIKLVGNTEFKHNHWCLGGAIITFNSSLTFTGNTTFIANRATNTLNRPYTNCYGNGGAIYTLGSCVLSFNGTSNFINNWGGYGGAIQITENNVLSFSGTSNFINNSAESGGGAIATGSNCTLTFKGTINFTNNTVSGDTLGGGGLYMKYKSTFFIYPNTTIYWENNHAQFGGAIFVHDASPISYCTSVAPFVPQEECFFQLSGHNLATGSDIQLVFKNNSADIAGSVIYGGAVDNCKLTGQNLYKSGAVFDMIVKSNDSDYNTTSNISSDPFRLCPCENNLPNCNMDGYEFPYTVYPGEMFQVSVAAVGQRNGIVPSAVISLINKETKPNAQLPQSQNLQQVNNNCTTLTYTLLSLSQQVEIDLHAEDSPCNNDKLSISVDVNQTCPPGFKISESARSCICEPRLAQYIGKHQCNIIHGLGLITRNLGQHVWVGYDSQTHGLVLHPNCPFQYCVNDTVVFPLNNTDVQCAFNRSGLLCGRCKKGYSLVLGTSQCKMCTNSHLLLLIPFALMGVALVFLLLVCKLTVATGTLSGLVFYANIIGANHAIFLPEKSTNVFTVFIAWLNLDFSIETCFYNGMDAYSKTWLQFVFPVYIWVLVGLMIIFSHYSHRFANLLGNNPVSALATLILLSYTKILRTLIAVIYVTYLQYPTYNRGVWLYDANVDYFSGKHIPLFLVAVFSFLFLFLPYTLLLLCGQWLQAISHLRLFSWVNSARLKPFMDSYHAPYKARHRYWPGLLLVLRFALLLVFAFNFQEDHRINLLAILVAVGFIVVWAWVCGGIYRNWCLNALEGLFALNLIILVGATCFVKLAEGNPSSKPAGKNQLALGYTSVSIAFVLFIGILIFQLAKVTGIAQYLERKCGAIANRDVLHAETEVADIGSLPDRLVNPEEYEPPFNSPHATAEPTEREAQRRLITNVYTGSYNSCK